MGREEGKPEWDWGAGREGTAPGLRGGLGFSFPGAGAGAWFIFSRDRPFPL